MLGWVIRCSVIWELLKKMVSVSSDSVFEFSCPRSWCPLSPMRVARAAAEKCFFLCPLMERCWKTSIQILQWEQIMCFWRKLLKYFYYKSCTSLLQEKWAERASDWWTPYYNQNFSWACLTCLEKKSSLTKHSYIHLLPELVTSACFK